VRPAKAPCKTCPYRRDVPSGVWAEEEYAKLPAYDGSTGEQALAGAAGLFMCHQQDGCLCAGWVGCHDMQESLAVRLGIGAGLLSEEDVDALLDYESPVPLFASGTAAAAHGMAEFDHPGADAVKAIRRLSVRLTP
jgi:hypothetical protein